MDETNLNSAVDLSFCSSNLATTLQWDTISEILFSDHLLLEIYIDPDRLRLASDFILP